MEQNNINIIYFLIFNYDTLNSKMKEIASLFIGVALILAVVSITGAGAPSVSTNSFAEYSADIVISGGELGITSLGVDAIAATASATSNVTMAASNVASNPALTQGNWGFKVNVSSLSGLTTADATYQIDLKVNGTITDTVFVVATSSPANNERVIITFDLDTATISNQQSFVILATEV